MKAPLAGMVALAAFCLPGCPPRWRCPPSETILPLWRLVADYNANADAVPRLWARAKVAVKLADTPLPWGSTVLPPNAWVLLAKGPKRLGPHDFLLMAREAGVDVFRVGSSLAEGVYYFWYAYGDGGRAWWGRHKLAGAPGTGMPIDPMQLLEVLCVCPLPDDQADLPAVAVSMSTEPCAYVLTYIDRRPVTGHIGLRREVYFRWSADEPPRPFLMHFLDGRGRRVMTAKLKDYKPIEVRDIEPAPRTAPIMPTDIEITWTVWPETADDKVKTSSIHIVLSEMTTEDRWDREICRFRGPDLPAGLPQVQVDRHIPAGGRGK